MTSRVLAWCGLGVEMTGDHEALDQLEHHLPPFYGGAGEVIAKGTLDTSEGLVVELPDGLGVSGAYGTETFRAAASRIELLIAAHLPNRVAVHAGVVAWEGRAIVVPGLSMSGKSTLVRAFVDAGALYVTDEFALLDADGLVWPYPRRMTIRTPTRTERQMPSHAADVAGPPLPVGVVADLVYSGEWDASPATKGQTVMALAAHALPIKHDPSRTLDSLTAVAGSAACVRGTRGEASVAIEALLALL